MAKKFDTDGISSFWVESSEKDWKTMGHLLKSKDYAWALFLGHLVIEKLLKAMVVKQTNSHPPFIHSLTSLARSVDVELSNDKLNWLEEINSFNMNARYDDVKFEFYKKCTKQFAAEWVEKIKILRKWLKKELSQ